MCQPWCSRDIADSIDVRLIGLQPFIGNNMTAILFDFSFFKANTLITLIPTAEITFSTSIISVFLPLLTSALNRACRLIQLFNFRAGDNLHTLLFKGLLGVSGNFLILHQQNTIHKLNDRDLRAHRFIEARKLNADRAGANDKDALGEGLWHHCFFVGPDMRAIGLKAGQLTRARTGGQNDMLGF